MMKVYEQIKAYAKMIGLVYYTVNGYCLKMIQVVRDHVSNLKTLNAIAYNVDDIFFVLQNLSLASLIL